MNNCNDPNPKETTSKYYRTCNLPKRFEYPSWFHGYGTERQPPLHPCYRTTSGDYGRYPPNIHSVPTSYYPHVSEFTNFLSRFGMYRNYSLNTGLEKPRTI
ncbi:UPF0691 protein C9orf116 [Agrilus planipennis]|uniref:UPF0691 protein C9orf116 n=1 Tax=Agrilus planipennis TaxID=224129 RepID=A0A1W4WH72_AGRPL|nr:UPF0691 protein C9orf116 [Agrilus planipennis]